MKKIGFVCLMFLLSIYSLDSVQTDSLEKRSGETASKKTEAILLTYPRSGTNWTIGILQALCKRTVRWIDNRGTVNRLDFEIDESLPIVYRTHGVNQRLVKLKQSSYSLIFTLRNFKECVIKETKYTAEEFVAGLLENDPQITKYFDNLEFFDSGWKNPETKHMIVYEEMIQNPQDTIISLLTFLGESLEKVPEFFEHYDEWNAEMLASYHRQHRRKGPSSQNQPLFHSIDFSKESLIAMDKAVQERYPILWEKYLKRYAENSYVKPEVVLSK